TRSGLVEQRWFVIAGPAAARASLNSDQAKALIRFAPAAAQLVQARAQRENSEDAARAVSHALFGVLPAGASEPNDIPPDRTRATDEDGGTGGRTERYSHLDARFDRDVDDEQAPGEKRGGPQFSDSKPGSSNLKAEPAGADRDGSAFAKRLGQILKPASPDAYCELARSKVETGKPFVGFERAVVIETEPEKLDRAAIEGAIIEEMRSRFVVGGVDPGLNWQDEGDVRFLAQTLLEQGAAVGVAGKYIVVASSKEFARDILQAGSAAASTTATIEGDVEFYAVIRVAAAKSIFDRLMSTLDMKPQAQEEDQTHEVRFFSENLSSLVSAAGFREVRVRRASEGALMVETVLYSW
ncbi:MAG TPA: hypothetical protein VJH03_21320, partial [Blastocatellia bacterium]|nr:hypothetical protein [Blastocatellia bacterium]